MRIVSKFKDYYDFISHRYGSDPGCTYVRGKIARPAGGTKESAVYDARVRQLLGWHTLSKDACDKGYSLDVVVAGPHAVPILRRNYYLPQFDRAVESEAREDSTRLLPEHGHLIEVAAPIHNSHGWKTGEPKWPRLPQGEKLHELIRHVGAPVFRVRGTSSNSYGYGYTLSVTVSEFVPILKDLGFPSLFAPEVIWQDIYTTLTSVLRRDPDKAPPVEVSEKIRIEYAGFDLKSSFRHPVNPKKVK